MIKKNKILIWTTLIWTAENKNWFFNRHKLNSTSNDFKDIKFTNFNVSEKDLSKKNTITMSSFEYHLSKQLWEQLKAENISHYDVIIFDLKCWMILPFNGYLINPSSNDFIINILLSLIKKHKDKTFLILNADLEDDLDNIFWRDTEFNFLKLERKRSSQITSINQTNISGEIVSSFCLNDKEVKKYLSGQKIKKEYRPLWYATGNKNEITGFQIENMYFLPFSCDALASILKNIDSLFDNSKEFNEEKIFNLLNEKDPDSSLKSLKFIDNLWKKYSNKKELIKSLSKTKQELNEYIARASLFLKALEYHDKPLESIIKKILKHFKFEILSQNEKDHDQADIVFSFNHKKLKYITIVEVKSYEKNKIDRKPFNQVLLWSDKFINENRNTKFYKIIKLIVVNNGYKSFESQKYDQRILKIPANIEKHYGYRDVKPSDEEIVDDIKVITTLNLVKILYSDEDRGAELLKEKLVTTKATQIEPN